MSAEAKKALQTVEGTNPWPKHHQVYMVLKQLIRDGVYTSEKSLPNEIALAEQFKVSRITVRKAMERLEREGTVERTRGRGTFVKQETGDSPLNASLSGSIENLIAMGLKTKVRVVDFTYVPANLEIAGALEITPGTLVQKVVRVRSHQGVPFSHLTTYVPEDLGRSYNEEDMTTLPLLMLLERGGAKIGQATQTITARLAVPDVASLLEIEPGEALLSIKRLVRDVEGRPVECITGLYRPDTYEHHMSFNRNSTGAGTIWNS